MFGFGSRFRPQLKDIVVEKDYIQARVGLFKWNKKFYLAQEWLDREIMRKARPIIPYKTGAFLGRIEAANAGRYGSGKIVMVSPPQGHYLYNGVSRFSGKPLHYTNPRTVPFWGSFVIREYRHEFKDGVARILRGK